MAVEAWLVRIYTVFSSTYGIP